MLLLIAPEDPTVHFGSNEGVIQVTHLNRAQPPGESRRTQETPLSESERHCQQFCLEQMLYVIPDPS